MAVEARTDFTADLARHQDVVGGRAEDVGQQHDAAPGHRFERQGETLRYPAVERQRIVDRACDRHEASVGRAAQGTLALAVEEPGAGGEWRFGGQIVGCQRSRLTAEADNPQLDLGFFIVGPGDRATVRAGLRHRIAQRVAQGWRALVGRARGFDEAIDAQVAALVAEPDEDHREHDHVDHAASEAERIQLDPDPVHRQSDEQVKQRRQHRRRAGHAPAPAKRGGEHQERKEGQERAGEVVAHAFGEEHRGKEREEVYHVRRPGQPVVPPPAAPGDKGQRKRDSQVSGENEVTDRAAARRLVRVDPQREEEDRRQHQARHRDNAA